MDKTKPRWMKSLLMMVCLLALLPAAAADVYRWTDENGQVHYGQRPPPSGADRLELPETGAIEAGVDTEIQQRRARQQRLLDSYDYEREQKRAEQAREAEDRQQAATRCAKLQQYWRRLSYGGPVYHTGADGEREYLSDQQRAAEKAKIRPAFVRACGREP